MFLRAALVNYNGCKYVLTWQKGAHSATMTWNLRFPRRVFQERLHRSGAADGHNDLVRVDVFQRLHGDVVCGAL